MYNGWTNYETWNFALWIDNDYSMYRFTRNYAELDDVSAYDLGETLKELAESNADAALRDDCKGFVRDILTASIDRINFREVAEHIFEDVEEKESEEC